MNAPQPGNSGARYTGISPSPWRRPNHNAAHYTADARAPARPKPTGNAASGDTAAQLEADRQYRRNSLCALIRVTGGLLKEAIRRGRPAAEVEAIRQRRQQYLQMLRRLG